MGGRKCIKVGGNKHTRRRKRGGRSGTQSGIESRGHKWGNWSAREEGQAGQKNDIYKGWFEKRPVPPGAESRERPMERDRGETDPYIRRKG